MVQAHQSASIFFQYLRIAHLYRDVQHFGRLFDVPAGVSGVKK